MIALTFIGVAFVACAVGVMGGLVLAEREMPPQTFCRFCEKDHSKQAHEDLPGWRKET